MKNLCSTLRSPRGLYGIGLFWAWIYCAWYTPALSANSTGFTVWSNPFCEQSCIVLAVTLLGLLIFHKRVEPMPRHVFALASLVLCSASFAAYFLTFSKADSRLAVFLCCICLGISSAFIMTLWVRKCCSLNFAGSENVIPLSFLPAPVCTGLCLLLPQPISTCFMALLPLASAFLFYRTNLESSSSFKKPSERLGTFFRKSRELPSCIARLSLGALTVEALLSFLLGSISQSGIDGFGGSFMVFAGGSLVGVAFLVAFIKFAKRPGVFALMRVDICLGACTALLLASSLPFSDICGATMLIAAQMGLDALLIVNFARLSQMGWKSPLYAAIVSRLPLQTGVIIGNIGALLAAEGPTFSALSAAFIATFCTILAAALSTRDDDQLASAYLLFEQAAHKEDLEREHASEYNAVIEPTTLERKCSIIAKTKRFTPREADVLPYLARGMSVPFISTKLVVSRNTVDTHVRNIYRKLDIHSRDELIELVEHLDYSVDTK